MNEDLKHTPEILSAKDLQDMGFSRSMAYALFNRADVPVFTSARESSSDMRNSLNGLRSKREAMKINP